MRVQFVPVSNDSSTLKSYVGRVPETAVTAMLTTNPTPVVGVIAAVVAVVVIAALA
jgi:hypothetical protein